MATTFGRASVRERRERNTGHRSRRWGELFGLFMTSLVIVFGLWLVYQAKTTIPETTSFSEAQEKIKSKQLVILNNLIRSADLIPFLTIYDSKDEQTFVADKIYKHVTDHQRQLQNVGELRKIYVEPKEIDSNPQLSSFKERLVELRQTGAAVSQGPSPEPPLPLFTGKQFEQLKPSFIVRQPEEFRATFLLWMGIYVVIFFGIHVGWRLLKFNGDQLMLPIIQLLSGLGLILMISLRDPLRDTLTFRDFALGLGIGGALLFLSSLLDLHRFFNKITLIPLILAVLLSTLLIVFGSGPGTSDAKVNLLGAQPVEFIKIFVVLFLAGYFSEHWEFLRELKQKGKGLFAILRRWNAPRMMYFLPVAIAILVVLGFFFLQKDLGPALVLGCTFLAMYAVARNRSLLVVLGLSMLIAGFWMGYKFIWPVTVYQRTRIWLDVWDNGLRNGDQIAQGWWALANGGLTGTGLGLGKVSAIPAGYTDLVAASLGEELGFVGVTVLLLLYAVLIMRGLYIAVRANSNYSFFLALALVVITSLQIALITGGVLGLMPLSGVVSPFVSYGKSSMLANCLIFGMLLSISSRSDHGEVNEQFRRPTKQLTLVFAAIAIMLIGKAAYVQVLKADANVITPVLTKQADNVYRYVYNPRLIDAARLLPHGTVYDRNGIPLATSSWSELEKHRREYETLGVNIDTTCSKDESRHYPFGTRLFHLLGNSQTRDNWAAPNSDYIERDYTARLRGFDDHPESFIRTVIELDTKTRQTSTKEVTVLLRDFRELLPLVRYHHRPNQADVQNLLNREKDVRTSIDIRLQLRLEDIIQQQLMALNREKAAAVILDPQTGDLLASASYPWPSDGSKPPAPFSLTTNEDDIDQREAYLDRARFGLYPPGSTFKVVTAIAALRKDPTIISKTFECKPLGDGRVGNYVKGWSRPIRDDKGDAPHGSVQMEKGIIQSCNAYFAQLGTYEVGASNLLQTANLFGIEVAKPNTPEQLSDALPQAAYGQGQVVATPFEMARVAASIANDGQMMYGRWVIDDSNQRVKSPETILDRSLALFLGRAMRGVVETGTATSLRNISPAIAGKTGTAEIQGDRSHSWFIGFAPVNGTKKIAFAVIIENGGYGGRAAAPVAGEIVKMAHMLGVI